MESGVPSLITQVALYSLAQSMNNKRSRGGKSARHPSYHAPSTRMSDQVLSFDGVMHPRVFSDQALHHLPINYTQIPQSSSGKLASISHDPGLGLVPSSSSNSIAHKRTRSSGSASTSTAVTAPSVFAEDIPVPYATAPAARRRHYDSEPHTGEHGKKDKGKAAERSHSHANSSLSSTPRPRRHLPVEEEDFESYKDKHAQAYSGPLALAEFDRMGREIEQLKKSAQDSKKIAKKQAKEMKELKNRLQDETILKANRELEIKTLKDKAEKNEELLTTIESSLQCQICMDLLNRPHSLSGCGHILCLTCLQSWFRKAPASTNDPDSDPDDNDPYYLLNRAKTCPCCRAVVKRKPVPVFIVKNVVGVISKARDERAETSALGGRARSPSPDPDADPWKGLFRCSDDEDRDSLGCSDDDEDSEDDDDDYDDDRLGLTDSEDEEYRSMVRFARTMSAQFGLGYVTSSPSGSDVDDEDEDEDEEFFDGRDRNDEDEPRGGGSHDHDHEHEHEHEHGVTVDDDDEGDTGAWSQDTNHHDPDVDMDPIYVPQRWQPPNVTIDPADYEGFFDDRDSEGEEERRIIGMLRRGCTYSMIRTYLMEYSHGRGLVARLKSLDEPTANPPSSGLDAGCHRLFLGWNLHLDPEDVNGEMYVERLLHDMKDRPEEWECTEREEGLYDVERLVREGTAEAEEYETTDTEVWVGATHKDEDGDMDDGF